MASFGIDVSEWQGTIDWPKVAAAGVDFAFIRAGYGADRPDRLFDRNWAGAAAAGVKRGAYLWVRPTQSPIDQAEYLVAKCHDGELAPWLDFETAENVGAYNAVDALARTVAHVWHRLDVVPVIYTGPGFWRSLGGVWAHLFAAASFPLAIAHYTKAAAPDVPLPWRTWTYWQHSSAGGVAGVGGPVDLDVAATLPLLTAAGHDPSEHPMAHLNAPVVDIVANPAGAGYWQVAGDGGVFAWGGAPAFDDPLPGIHLNAPIIAATPTPTGRGLWLTAADGGVFPIGDAELLGAVTQLQ